MTFDFAPDQFGVTLDSPSCVTLDRVPAGHVPPYPDNAAIAALLGELFTEGTLGVEQMWSLVGLPELRPHIQLALARAAVGWFKDTPP